MEKRASFLVASTKERWFSLIELMKVTFIPEIVVESGLKSRFGRKFWGYWLLWVELCLPQLICWSSNTPPSTSEWDYLEIVVRDVIQLWWGPAGVEWAANTKYLVSSSRKKFGHKHTYTQGKCYGVIGPKLPQAEELPEVGEKPGADPSLVPSEGA